jgi:hypothetical protein
MVDEPKARMALTMLRPYGTYIDSENLDAEQIGSYFLAALGIDEGDDATLAEHVRRWVVQWQHLLHHPPADAKFPADALPGGARPMRSLRDVEPTAPITDVTRRRAD